MSTDFDSNAIIQATPEADYLKLLKALIERPDESEAVGGWLVTSLFSYDSDFDYDFLGCRFEGYGQSHELDPQGVQALARWLETAVFADPGGDGKLSPAERVVKATPPERRAALLHPLISQNWVEFSAAGWTAVDWLIPSPKDPDDLTWAGFVFVGYGVNIVVPDPDDLVAELIRE